MADDSFVKSAIQALRPWFEKIAPRITNKQAVALSRASTLTARSFARELLDRRRLWTPELVDEAFDDPAETPVYCVVAVAIPGWLHGMRALMSMSDAPWARARLASRLRYEIDDYLSPPDFWKSNRSKPEEHVTMLAAAIMLQGSVAGGLEIEWLRVVAENQRVPAELRQAALETMKRARSDADQRGP